MVAGQTGVLAPPERLGAALTTMLTDGLGRERMARAAQRRARTLTWDASALGILRVFHRVVMTGRR